MITVTITDNLSYITPKGEAGEHRQSSQQELPSLELVYGTVPGQTGGTGHH